MDLQEFLAQNPDARKELEGMIADARHEGIASERARIKSLDALSGTVTTEAMNDAKYGENPIDGPTLAYQAMVKGEKAAASYMANAIQDSKDSGVDDVGVGELDEEEASDESDALAAVVNKERGGR